MSTFVLTYRAPKGYTIGSPEVMPQWRAFFEGMGASISDLGKPVMEASVLGNAGTDTRLGGYTVITAEDLEAAISIAKGCPFLGIGGGVEVGLLGEVPA